MKFVCTIYKMNNIASAIRFQFNQLFNLEYIIKKKSYSY